MKTSTYILTGLGAGAILGVLLAKPGSAVMTPSGSWRDGDAPRRIQAYAGDVEDIVGWPGLADYLTAVAWSESRGDSQAVNNPSANAATGWFQLRPQSAMADRSDLLDERQSVMLAADYAQRLRKYHSGTPTWLALRRGWALPSLVSDENETNSRSTQVRHNFEEALDAVGLPRSFMNQDAFPRGFVWPGRDAVLSQMG